MKKILGIASLILLSCSSEKDIRYVGVVKESVCGRNCCRVITEDDQRITVNSLVIRGDDVYCKYLNSCDGVWCFRGKPNEK